MLASLLPANRPLGLVVEHGREHGRSPGPFGPTNGWRLLRSLKNTRVGTAAAATVFVPLMTSLAPPANESAKTAAPQTRLAAISRAANDPSSTGQSLN